MRSGSLPLLGWGAGLLAIALLGAAGFGLDVLPALLLAGAGGACLMAGAATAVAGRARFVRAGEPELLLRSSLATLVLTVGAALAFVGLVVVGPGLLWPGVWLLVAGTGGLVRERRAGRRLLRDARERRGTT